MPGLFPTRARHKKSPFLGLSGLKHLKKGDFLCRPLPPQDPAQKVTFFGPFRLKKGDFLCRASSPQEKHLFWAFPAPSTSKKVLKKGDFLCRASSPQEPGTKSHLFWAFPAPSTSKKVTFCAGPLPHKSPAQKVTFFGPLQVTFCAGPLPRKSPAQKVTFFGPFRPETPQKR